MNRTMRKIGACLLGAALALAYPGAGAQAAPYTYQVTIYAGAQGAFRDTSRIQVAGKKAGTDYRVEVRGADLVVTGLKRDDILTVQAPDAVAVNSERYYVKGVRRSGWDNNTVGTPAFPVTGDADYVVAYGIRGELVRYTVNYVSTEGEELAPGQQYYGNVGDKPVVAFLYVEGYEPQSYNLTRTLSANEAENVFTFTYREIPQPEAAPAPTAAPQEPGTGGAGAPQAPAAGGTAPAAPQAPQTGGAGAPEAPGAGAAGAGAGEETGAEEGEAGEAAPGGAGTAEAAGAPEEEEAAGTPEGGGLQEIPEEAVPQGLMDLDDEEQVPLADLTDLAVGPEPEGNSRALYVQFAAGAAALAALIGLAVLFVKRRKRDA